MIRNLKILGLMAVAALAMSAMFAAGAQAQAGTFTAGHTENEIGEVEHTAVDLTGFQYDNESEEWNKFETPNGSTIRCDESIFHGTDADGTATSLTIIPTYQKCVANGTQPATVTMNGCDYVFTQPTTEEGLEGYTGKADLTCPKGKTIVIHVYAFGSSTNGTHFGNVCTIEVTPHPDHTTETHVTDTLDGHVIYQHDTTEGKDALTVKADITNVTTDNGCPGGEEDEDAIYKQTVTVNAYKHNSAHSASDLLDAWISH